MAHILCLETATEVCSVALGHRGSLLREKSTAEGLKHSTHLTVLIEELLEEAKIVKEELDAVAISDGPGSYTGLRVGAGVAKGLCFGLGIPLIAISTLDAIAFPFIERSEFVMSAIDARRMEVYMAVYEKGERMIEPQSLIWTTEEIEKLHQQYSPLIITGNGVLKAKDL